MSYSKLILRDSAEIVWPLDDISSTASISMPINFLTPYKNSYSASINISSTKIQNIPMIFGGGSCLQFTSSAIGLSIPAINKFSDLYKDKNSVLSFWFKCDASTTEEQPIFKKRNEDNIGLFIKNNYLIFKFGSSSSYSQLTGLIVDIDEPHHIVVSAGPEARILMIDGVEYRQLIDDINHPIYISSSYQNNNFIDFYGPKVGSWEIDCPAYFPNLIDTSTAKRHYVYGLGKSIDDGIFFSRGGNIYNFTTIETEKIFEARWDYPEEWNLIEFKDLENTYDSIRPLTLNEPDLMSFDNNILTDNDCIKFNSSSQTLVSYIDIMPLSNKILDGSYPFFIKIKLDGNLPANESSQRIISYGEVPDVEKMNIDLYNDNNQYKVRININNFSSSLSFNISNISASPDIYIGMSFNGISKFYFAESASNIQTASFNLSSNDVINDPLLTYFPPNNDTRLRIGSGLTYDLKVSTPKSPFDFKQFRGTFKKFMVIQPEDISLLSSFNDLDNYRKIRYGFTYKSNEKRFLVSTYGYGAFNIHAADIGEYIDDVTKVLGGNIIEVGYPDIVSASNVIFNVTHYNYSGSVENSTQRINQKTFLGYLNNKNIHGTFLRFDFEIYTSDLLYYPPKIKYFHIETYKSTDNKVRLRDDAGIPYYIYPNSSSIVFLPETRLTPTIFLKNNSGIKINNSLAEFSEQIYPISLDPRSIDNLILWLDARFPLGLRRSKYKDDYRVDEWVDLSGNNFNAVQTSSALQPIYRLQSLNLLTLNQLTGSESDGVNNIISKNSTTESSQYGAIGGNRSIAVIPDGSSIDSYIDLSNNSASITVFPNQQYSVVGSIYLNKKQTASALHEYARSIAIYNSDGSTETLASISNQADNAVGTYSLSAVFSTASSTVKSIIKYYNGSYNQDDIVYWDNLGVYPVSSSIITGLNKSSSIVMPINTWQQPLTELNDSEILKFTNKMSLISSASISHPSSLYIVARNFNNSLIIQSTTASIFYSNSSSYFSSYGSPTNYSVSNNSFKVFSIINDGTNTEIFINGISQGSKNIGNSNIDKLIIGGNLLGDIASIVLYKGIHTTLDRQRIENWLAESFRVF